LSSKELIDFAGSLLPKWLVCLLETWCRTPAGVAPIMPFTFFPRFMKLHRLLLLVGLLALGALQRGYAQYATWARPLAPAAIGSRSVTDAAGNTYVAGSYRGALTLGTTTLPASTGPLNTTNAYVAKINPQGLVQWALAGVSGRADNVLALALAPGGDVHVAFRAGLDSMGQTPGTNVPFTLGSQTVASGGTLLAIVSPAGTVGTLTQLHQGGTNALVTSMTVEAAGNTLLSLSGGAGARFASYTFPSAGTGSTYSAAIFRVSPGGAPALVRSLVPTAPIQAGNYYYLRVEDVKTDAAGGIYCTGTLMGTAALGGTPALTLTATGNGYAAFVVKFSAAGVVQWGMSSTGGASGISSGSTTALCMALAPAGDLYLAGYAAGNIAFAGVATGGEGGFVAKFSAAGAPLWVRTALASTFGFDGLNGDVQLAMDAAGNVYKSGVLNRPSATFGGITLPNVLPLPGGTNAQHMYVVSYDAAGATRWARAVDGYQRATPTDSTHNDHVAHGLGADANGNVYLLNYKFPSSSTTQASKLLLNGQVLSDGYTLVRLSPASRLSGTLYIDQNNNGLRDTGEVPFPYPQIVSDQTQPATFSSYPGTGQYGFYGLPGTAYSITVPSPHPYYTVHAPNLHTGTFPALSQATTGLDFGLVPTANQADVRVTLTPVGVARPGFTVRYRLTLENRGTTTASGNANLLFDSRFSYVSSTPSGSRTGQTVTWAYTNLAPFAQLNYEVLLSLPTNATAGTVLASSATAPLTGDVALDDNTASAVQTVVTSYDPNELRQPVAHAGSRRPAARLRGALPEHGHRHSLFRGHHRHARLRPPEPEHYGVDCAVAQLRVEPHGPRPAHGALSGHQIDVPQH
jgi:hypothetical protein